MQCTQLHGGHDSHLAASRQNKEYSQPTFLPVNLGGGEGFDTI